MDKQILEQMYLTIKAIGDVMIEEIGTGSKSKQNLEYQLYMLKEIMTPYNATIQEIKELRELTGDGMIRCNKAIIMARGDKELAISLMQRGRV